MTITELIKRGTMYTFDRAYLDDKGKPKVVIYMHHSPAVLEFIEAENYENYPAEYGLLLFLRQSDISEFLDFHFEGTEMIIMDKINRLKKDLRNFKKQIKKVKSKLEK